MLKISFFFVTRFLIFSICLLAYSTSHSKWEKVIEAEGFSEYFEMDSVKKQGDVIFIWRMKDYQAPKENGIFSTKFYTVYQSAELKFKNLSIINYKTSMGKGRDFYYEKNISNEYDELELETPRPNTNDIKRLNFVCSYKNNN